MRIGDTPFEISADLSLLADGNSGFFVCASEPLADGKVTAGTLLYDGVVACQRATAPLAWRYLLKGYYSLIGTAPPLRTFSAPGLMPREFPWTAGFLTPQSATLPKDQRDLLWTIVQWAGSFLLPRCEQGARDTARVGNAPVDDPSLYPELADWAD